MPTTTTFLQLFRMIALYYPTKKILRGANVDDESDLNSEERLTVLTNYHDWIKGGYKENKKKQDAFRKFVKDLLLDGITVQVETELQNSSQTASTSDNVIFYIGGYMVNKIQKRSKCMTCIDSVKGGLESLPKRFRHSRFNRTKKQRLSEICIA